MALKVTYRESGDWAVLQAAGELDLVTSPALRGRVHEAVADGSHLLVLDLSEVVFCDSSGVGVLVATRRLIRSCQGRLRLILSGPGADGGTPDPAEPGRGGAAHVNRVLAALGVRRLFDIYPDVTSATDEESSPLSV